MPKVQKNLVDKVKVLADTVKKDLRKKGVIIPVKHKDGTISFDNYSVVKRTNGYYILNIKGSEVAGPINLAQTAIVLANGLALGRQVDDNILHADKYYGYRFFDEEVFTKSANNSLKTKDYDRADWCFTRASIARKQKEVFKATIMSHFGRLKTA
jgi:hypothetical protein